jgi:hypothetical protein
MEHHLQHELWDDPMEVRILEMQPLPGLAFALLSSAEGTKVLHCLWHCLSKETHHNAP